MNFLILLSIFVFGTIIGSFLNVYTCRYNTGATVGGRSFCFSCNQTLCWYELIPVLSFLIQKGKCRTCSSKISIQYPIVEVLTGITFVHIFIYQFSLFDNFSKGLILNSVYYAIIFSLFIIISVYDFRHKIIPERPLYLLLGLSLLSVFFSSSYLSNVFINISDNIGFISGLFLSNIVAGLILFLPFALLWYFSKGKWIGFGDAKLAFTIGLLLGLSQGITAIMMSFWIGAFFGLLFMLLSRFKNVKIHGQYLDLKSEVPFGPFMALATFLVFVLGIDFFDLMNWFSF